MPTSVRMRDIACKAGVHSSTVSRALRNDPRITAAVRARITELAQTMRYRPNPLISALISSRRSGNGDRYRATLGYLSKYPPALGRAFRNDYAPMLAGAAEAAARSGFALQEFKLDEPDLGPVRLQRILRARGIAGLVLAPLYSTDDIVGIDWSAFSVVAIGLSQLEANFTRVSHDHFADAQLVLRQCRARGYSRPGLIVPRRVNAKVENRWLAAYLLDQECRRSQDRVPALLLEGDDKEPVRTWYRRNRPDAVVCTHVPVAAKMLRAAGASIPDETGLASLGFAIKHRELAGIHHDLRRLGAAAVGLLISMLYRNECGIPAEPQTVLIGGHWTDGAMLPQRSLVQ